MYNQGMVSETGGAVARMLLLQSYPYRPRDIPSIMYQCDLSMCHIPSTDILALNGMASHVVVDGL